MFKMCLTEHLGREAGQCHLVRHLVRSGQHGAQSVDISSLPWCRAKWVTQLQRLDTTFFLKIVI